MTRQWSEEVDSQTRFIKPLCFILVLTVIVLVFNIYNYGAWALLIFLVFMIFTYARINRGLSAPTLGVKIAELTSKTLRDSDKRMAESDSRNVVWSDDDTTDLEDMELADERRAHNQSGYVGRRRKPDEDDDDLWL